MALQRCVFCGANHPLLLSMRRLTVPDGVRCCVPFSVELTFLGFELRSSDFLEYVLGVDEYYGRIREGLAGLYVDLQLTVLK